MYEDDEIEEYKKISKGKDSLNYKDLIDTQFEEKSLEGDELTKKVEELGPEKTTTTKDSNLVEQNKALRDEVFDPKSNDDIKKLIEKNNSATNGLVIYYALKDMIELHHFLGRNGEGDNVWETKEWRFYDVTQGQKLKMQIKTARVTDILRRRNRYYNSLDMTKLSEDEKYEAENIDGIANIADWKARALEAKIYFNMSEKDFQSCNNSEYIVALAAAKYRETNPPFSQQEQR